MLKFELPMQWDDGAGYQMNRPANCAGLTLETSMIVGMEAARHTRPSLDEAVGVRPDVYWPLGQVDCLRVTSDMRAMPRPLRNLAIIDDNPAVLKALARLLRAHAFAVLTFQSGHQFLASLPEPLPDCLILDLQMPGMSGLEIQQGLARKGIRIPTIIITAHDEDGTRERCKSAGAIAYLAKPVPQAALFAAIEAAGGDGAC